MALVAAAGFALSNILVRLAGRRVAVLTGTGISVLASLALAVIPALVLELPELARIPVAGFLWIVLLAVVNYPLARTLNYASIGRIGAARAAPLFSHGAPLVHHSGGSLPGRAAQRTDYRRDPGHRGRSNFYCSGRAE